MIVGVGIDLTPIPRVAALLDRWGERFARKVFTDGERAYCDRRGQRAQHYAARFAAKEAALKALGVPADLSWHELEVVSDGAGAPRLDLAGRAAEAAARLGARRAHLSLTHAGDMAAAVVVLEG